MVLHNLTNKQNMFCGLFAVVMNKRWLLRVYTLLSFKNAIVTNVKKKMDSV